MDTTLVVMAAGMGSRFGGLKQIEPVGPNGEVILDFSVFDAVKSGFNKVVFIIRRDIEADFKEITKQRIEKSVDVEYVFQDMDNLPGGFKTPDGRTKPWGTGHAVYCAKEKLTTPFALINADDFYGRSTFETIHNSLINGYETCMVGFKLGNTLTDNGTVARGVCDVDNGYLKKITEYTAIDKNSGVPLDTTVSMNMWGLTPKIFDYMETDFMNFLNNMKNPLKDEYYIQSVINLMMKDYNEKVKVFDTNEKWYGVTYKDDKKMVVDAMKKLYEEGFYDGI